jgi:hypothetical protein
VVLFHHDDAGGAWEYTFSKSKSGIFRDGLWCLDNGNLQWDGEGPGLDTCGGFGLLGDVPRIGDWDGNGQDEVAVFRGGVWFLDNGNLQWDGCGTDGCGAFGLPGDEAVVGHW